MTEPKELKWGQTPWDDMSREDLILWCRRMYSAVTASQSALGMSEALTPDSPYWGPRGGGGSGLCRCRQITKEIESRFDSESIYRAAGRYEADLLFDGLGNGWVICPECKTMTARDGIRIDAGRLCCDVYPLGDDTPCTGILRLITWDDMKPIPEPEP